MKTKIQKLAFRIAERITSDFILHDMAGEQTDTEYLYREIYSMLPESLEGIDEIMEEAEDESFIKPIQRGPSLMTRLREAVHATEEMSLRTVLEAACAKCERLNDLLD